MVEFNNSNSGKDALPSTLPENFWNELVSLLKSRGINQYIIRDKLTKLLTQGNILSKLSGASIEKQGINVDFSAAQTGDIVIRDIVGGSVYHINLSVSQIASPKPSDISNQDTELIEEFKEKLRMLELQAAQYGIYCPINILIDIKKLRKEIASLQ